MDFPKLEITEPDQSEVIQVAEKFKLASECPNVETGQPEAFYAPASDMIYILIKGAFKVQESYYKTGRSLFHRVKENCRKTVYGVIPDTRASWVNSNPLNLKSEDNLHDHLFMHTLL